MEDRQERQTQGDGVGRYQGAHSRRVDRYIIGVVFAVFLFKPISSGDIFNAQWFTTILLFVAIAMLCEWWFVRRRGADIQGDRLTLHYFWGKTHVPWSRIQDFQWRTRVLERGEYLSATLIDGSRVWIPTVGRASSRGPLGDFFGSSNIRSRTGIEVDALAAFDSALALARQRIEPGVSVSG